MREKKVIKEEMFKNLDRNVSYVKGILINKIKFMMEVSEKEAEKIYKEWKTEYMKYKG